MPTQSVQDAVDRFMAKRWRCERCNKLTHVSGCVTLPGFWFVTACVECGEGTMRSGDCAAHD